LAGAFGLDGARAHVTAPPMSASVRFSSANLARTASPRWMRTGVNTICPSRVCTSKYSAGPTACVTLLGSVSWFFEVILASMSASGRKVRIPYFTRLAIS
jgi:hypothetical protein